MTVIVLVSKLLEIKLPIVNSFLVHFKAPILAMVKTGGVM